MKWQDLFEGHRWRFRFTLFLLLVEYGLSILFPLFIGFAIDDALEGSARGTIELGVLGLAELIVGMGRRVYDSRLYAKIYLNMGEKILTKASGSTPSVKSARLQMLKELVEFMENSLPDHIGTVVGLVGILSILAGLNLKVFLAALVCMSIFSLLYLLTSKRTVQYNRHYNDELEAQVDVIASEDPVQLHEHLKAAMKWNIKLSDLEAGNFSFSWFILLGFILLSILLPIQDGERQYGALFALVMYALDYLRWVLYLPIIYQQWLRLSEIRQRLSEW